MLEMRGAQLTAEPCHVLAIHLLTRSRVSIQCVGFSRIKDFWGRLEVDRKKKAKFFESFPVIFVLSCHHSESVVLSFVDNYVPSHLFGHYSAELC